MRHLLILPLMVITFTGCQQPTAPVVGNEKIEPAPEMRLLEKFVGTWEESGRIVEPTPEQIRAGLKEGQEMPPTTWTGGNTADFTLDGMYLRTEGWAGLPDGGKMKFVEYKTWDRQAQKFRMTWFGNDGTWGNGWMTADPDGRTFDVSATGWDVHGTKKTWTGSFTFTGNNSAKWDWVEKGPSGMMKMEGENKRQI